MITDVRMLAGRYRLEERLGEGSLAQVYRATDLRLGRTFAVKLVLPAFCRDAAFVERMAREARVASRLHHPNIVSVHETGFESGRLFIVMDQVQGTTLAEVLRDTGPLPPERALRIARDVAGALSVAHQAGIVHGKVTPGNIMVTSSGDVRLTDFGIHRAPWSGHSLTRATMVLGTAGYLSPEQARGQAPVGRSDVYALGCVLFEMLTGRPPYIGDVPPAAAYRHVWDAPAPPSRSTPGIHPEVDAVVLKAMAGDPAKRYQTAHQLRAALDRIRRVDSPVVPPVPVASGGAGEDRHRGPRGGEAAPRRTTVLGPWMQRLRRRAPGRRR